MLRRREDVVHREIADGAVLLDLRDGSYFELNEMGSTIWQLIEDVEEPDIVAAVRDRYADVPPTVSQLVHAFITALRERELVEDA